MSSEFGRQVKRSEATFDSGFSLRRKETQFGRVWESAAGLRFPSFFLLATLKLPGWRWTLPVIFPLFVVEDLLESAGWLMSVVSRLSPISSAETRAHLGKDGGFSGDGWTGSCGHPDSPARWPGGRTLGQRRDQEREGRFSIEFSIRDVAPLLFFLAKIVRALRLEGRFTLVHVVEGASGTEIAIRLV